jgi:hypothetical protein
VFEHEGRIENSEQPESIGEQNMLQELRDLGIRSRSIWSMSATLSADEEAG